MVMMQLESRTTTLASLIYLDLHACDPLIPRPAPLDRIIFPCCLTCELCTPGKHDSFILVNHIHNIVGDPLG